MSRFSVDVARKEVGGKVGTQIQSHSSPRAVSVRCGEEMGKVGTQIQNQDISVGWMSWEWGLNPKFSTSKVFSVGEKLELKSKDKRFP